MLCLQKRHRFSSALHFFFFFFFFFFEAFFIPVKNEKYDEGHKLKFREQELNETKIQAPFCKKANL